MSSRCWAVSFTLGLVCLAFPLVSTAAEAGGWHRPGESAPAAKSVSAKPAAKSSVRHVAAMEPIEEGPSLVAPTREPRPSASAKRAKKIVSDPAPEMPEIPLPTPNVTRGEQDAAERSVRMTRGGAARGRGVSRTSYDDVGRMMAPSAFAYQDVTSDMLGAPDSEPSTIVESMPMGSGEELPTPSRQSLPPINTDQLLHGSFPPGTPVSDDFGFEYGGMPGDCVDCGNCDSCGDCGPCGHGGCGGCGWFNGILQDLQVFGGSQGFKGPVDLGRNGNFGFHYGLNYGAPFWYAKRIGYQVGGQIVHSNLSGSNVIEPTDASRTQYFITAGFFQRAIECSPWQWGIAYDWLSDNYYVNMQFGKLRGELSFVSQSGDEIGAWASVDVMDDTKHYAINNQIMQLDWKSADLYAFFWRRHFCGGGMFRLWGGFTGDGNGMVGGDFRAPMSNHFSIEGNTNYLPQGKGGFENGALGESWALAINLVYYVGGGAGNSACSPWRPLFNVADNSIFMFSSAK